MRVAYDYFLSECLGQCLKKNNTGRYRRKEVHFFVYMCLYVCVCVSAGVLHCTNGHSPM